MSDAVTSVEAIEFAKMCASNLRGVPMTAEVWPRDADTSDPGCDQATIVDIVRIDHALHFVVLLDG